MPWPKGRPFSEGHKLRLAEGKKRYKRTPEHQAKIAQAKRITSLNSARPTKKPVIKDIAWAAGFYEGEGTCGADTSFRVSVSQVDVEVLERFRNLFGGRIYVVHRRPTNPNHSVLSRWELTGIRAHGFALTVFYFLSRRRRIQMLTALEKVGYRRAA